MKFNKGDSLDNQYFLVKVLREFDWGIVGSLSCRDCTDISFKFSREHIEGAFEAGKVICVDGIVGEYNGQPQVTGSCTVVENPYDFALEQVVPTTTVNVEAEFIYMLNCVDSMSDKSLQAITSSLLAQYHRHLKKLPAGMSMHHCCVGGWIEHTVGILRSALAISEVYDNKLNRDLLTAGAILHDIGKVYEFQVSNVGLVSEYTFLGEGVGHASLGVGMVMSTATQLGINLHMPSVAALLNIIGTHSGNREWGACADPISKEAIVIANLDYMDAHINALTETLSVTPTGDKAYNKSLHKNVYQTAI